MAGDEQVLARGRWSAIVPQALRSVLVAVLVGVLPSLLVGEGSAGAAVVGSVLILAVLLVFDAAQWWQLRGTGYSVVDGSLVVRGRRWSQSYPLAEVERADVVGAATWRRTTLNLLASRSPAYPLARLQVCGQPVWGPRVAVWGVAGAAALQESLDAVLAEPQRV